MHRFQIAWLLLIQTTFALIHFKKLVHIAANPFHL
jgi:hypothetical protein